MIDDYAVYRISGLALATARQHIVTGFLEPVGFYQRLSNEEYQQLVAVAQDDLNKLKLTRIFAFDLQDSIYAAIGEEKFLVQSNLYLRAIRPFSDTDHVGWHRESFYGGPPESLNCWIPIANVSYDNGLYYVPGSASVPTEALEIVSTDEGAVERFSSGHRTGLLYAPKKIVNGVDFNSKERMRVKIGEAALFSGELIHGAGDNPTDFIRFSIDFRVLPWSARDKAKQNQHFASGQQQFVEIN